MAEKRFETIDGLIHYIQTQVNWITNDGKQRMIRLLEQCKDPNVDPTWRDNCIDEILRAISGLAPGNLTLRWHPFSFVAPVITQTVSNIGQGLKDTWNKITTLFGKWLWVLIGVALLFLGYKLGLFSGIVKSIKKR